MFFYREIKGLITALCLLGYGGNEEPVLKHTTVSLHSLKYEDSTINAWWLINIVNNGKLPEISYLKDWNVRYQAEIWNSAVRSHRTYRSVDGVVLPGLETIVRVEEAEDGDCRCSELVKLSLFPKQSEGMSSFYEIETIPENVEIIPLTSGTELWLGCQLKHFHEGRENELLLFGGRVITLSLEDYCLFADFNLSPNTKINLSSIPKDRKNQRIYLSPPDSLYLRSEIPGYHFFRFSDFLVNSSDRLNLSCSYFTTSRGLSVKLNQYQDGTDGFENLETETIFLSELGKWTAFKKTFIINDGANSAYLQFSLGTSEILDEAWIDNISLNKENPRLIPRLNRLEWYRPVP
ncbi:MAG: hypothetical protein AABX77_02790 [Nanoarchaeota archaeon]